MWPNRLGQWAIAAWLGVVALGLNALVPIHLAFDLAHALAPERHHHDAAAADRDFVQCLLSLLTGHHDEADDDGPAKGSHHHDGCAVCGAIGTLAGLAPAPVVGLAHPALVDAPALPNVRFGTLRAASPAAYRSRAPPFA